MYAREGGECRECGGGRVSGGGSGGGGGSGSGCGRARPGRTKPDAKGQRYDQSGSGPRIN